LALESEGGRCLLIAYTIRMIVTQDKSRGKAAMKNSSEVSVNDDIELAQEFQLVELERRLEMSCPGGPYPACCFSFIS
jgi:hypothetical protein